MQFSFLLSLFVWSAYKHSCISPISSNKYPPAAWSGYCTNKAMTEFTHKHMGLIHMLTKANTCMYTDWEPESCRKCWQALVNRGSAVSPSASLTTHAHSSSGSHPDANTQIMLVYPCMCEIHTFGRPSHSPAWLIEGLAPPGQVCVFSYGGEAEMRHLPFDWWKQVCSNGDPLCSAHDAESTLLFVCISFFSI